ncbi:hypothetical protein [Methylobacterium planeticum]|uniref:Uncharacterized protein n=1 Tax=Methylobacterium planeticum TaxID=2615211 RepID=A0A6N6MG02_9HYPH|nr:hypothetical protein [Methylobacterium planeticum]KAB1068752.1 hypothetical protein F6X51_26445 [Methylobacterium planeticum]
MGAANKQSIIADYDHFVELQSGALFNAMVGEAAIAIANEHRDRRGWARRPSAFDRLPDAQRDKVQQEADAAVRAALFVLRGWGQSLPDYPIIEDYAWSQRW